VDERVKILFVDDEERIVRLLKVIFRDKYDVYTALSGSEAIELLKATPVDIVVSDQRMPGMLGHELLSHVREMMPRTVRVLLTGYSDLVAIIGAINEGEVYRFLNKPWKQDELRMVVQECAEFAISNRQAWSEKVEELASETDGQDQSQTPPLATATKLLALEGIDNQRYELMEMFTQDFNVIGATTASEAMVILAQHNVGVVVARQLATEEETVEVLTSLKENYPLVPVVLVSEAPDSKLLVKLINQAEIYRFAMKPMSPNLFRLAISAAMKEHHRRLADPRMMARAKAVADARPGEFADSVIKNLSRFSDVW